MSDNDIKQVASSPGLRSISSMCHLTGFPSWGAVNTFLTLPCLMTDGSTNLEIVSCISSMRASRGIPETGEVISFLQMPILCQQERVNLEILKCISAICHAKGIPARDSVLRLLRLESLQRRDEPNLEILKTIALMAARHGMPAIERVDALLKMTKLFAGNNDARQMRFLRCFSTLYKRIDIPVVSDIITLLLSPALQTNGRFDLLLLEAVADLHAGRGFPGDNVITQARQQISQWDVDDDPEAFSVPDNIHEILTSLGIAYDPGAADSQPSTSAAARAALPQHRFLASSSQQFVRRREEGLDQRPSTSGDQRRLSASSRRGDEQTQPPLSPTTPELFAWLDQRLSSADEGASTGSAASASRGTMSAEAAAHAPLSSEESKLLDWVAEMTYGSAVSTAADRASQGTISAETVAREALDREVSELLDWVADMTSGSTASAAPIASVLESPRGAMSPDGDRLNQDEELEMINEIIDAEGRADDSDTDNSDNA